MLLEQNAKILFTGDSVTDCGRIREAYPGTSESLGDGYANLISAALTAIYPEKNIMVQNTGASGDTSTLLLQRFETDVLQQTPDYLSILIGVNDVWRHFDAPFYHPTDLVSLAQYCQNYQDLIQQAKPQVKQIFILSPFMFDSNLKDSMRKMLDQYRQVAKELAEENQLMYIDLQTPIDNYLKTQSSYILSSDRIHPNIKGHMLITSLFLNAIGFNWQH